MTVGHLLEQIDWVIKYLRVCARLIAKWACQHEADRIFELCDTIQRAITAYMEQRGP